MKELVEEVLEKIRCEASWYDLDKDWVLEQFQKEFNKKVKEGAV